MKSKILPKINHLISPLLPTRIDNKFQVPRIWSNAELRKFAHLFSGSIVNVSGWIDKDKEGGHYQKYFCNAESYIITNYADDGDRGLQGLENEISLDLQDNLHDDLLRKFDVVFNHTVLEHIYDTRKAFSNICKLSKQAVITIVPYMQQLHGINDNVGDYWRFTPFTMKKLYEENQFKLQYCSSNGDSSCSSIYLFCIGYRGHSLDDIIPLRFDTKINTKLGFNATNAIGAKIIE